jgi:hypothetical protein
VGKVEISRPYYLCAHCHSGQFPADVELDIQNTDFSPGVRRMQAVVGQDAPFDHGRQQMKLLKWDEKGYAIRDPDSTTYVGAIETAEEFGKRIYWEAWKRGWSRAENKAVIGDGAECRERTRNRGSGTLPINISLVRFRLWIFITPANICGNWRANCIPTKRPNKDAG